MGSASADRVAAPRRPCAWAGGNPKVLAQARDLGRRWAWSRKSGGPGVVLDAVVDLVAQALGLVLVFIFRPDHALDDACRSGFLRLLVGASAILPGVKARRWWSSRSASPAVIPCPDPGLPAPRRALQRQGSGRTERATLWKALARSAVASGVSGGHGLAVQLARQVQAAVGELAQDAGVPFRSCRRRQA